MKAYIRCNGGHYFQSISCPFDGWSSPATKEFADVLTQLNAAGVPISLQTLRKAGLHDEVLRLVIAIEFGDTTAEFEAVAPREYIARGKSMKDHEYGAKFS